MNLRRAMFVVQVVWLLVLGAVAAFVFLAPDRVALPETFGPIPIGVVWFGALGAVLISLTGIVEHADDWKDSYTLWHLSRPFMGGSLAVVAVMILQAGILAVGTAPTTGAAASAPKNILYYLIAFLVGYREETFRELIKRLVDLVFTPASTGAQPAAAVGGATQAQAPAPAPAAVAVGPEKLQIAKQPGTATQEPGSSVVLPTPAEPDATDVATGS